CLQYNSDPLTI
nr:immunoglobulin light chain junction region [Macaca mulatta]